MIVGGRDGCVVDGEGARECGGVVAGAVVGGAADVGVPCAVVDGVDGGVGGTQSRSSVGGGTASYQIAISSPSPPPQGNDEVLPPPSPPLGGVRRVESSISPFGVG